MRRLLSEIARLVDRRDEVVGINRRNLALVYPHNPRAAYVYADDKLLAKRVFREKGVPVAETIAECLGLFAIDATLDALEDRSEFVVKPAHGSGGDGILVIGERLGPGRWRSAGGREIDRATLRKHLADAVFGAFSKELEDQALVEERVRPDDAFERVWPHGLCDVRVIALQNVPRCAMVRVPTSRSEGRANLHQGGIGLAVDLANGEVVRAVQAGRAIDRHPDSGAPLLGWRIPRWDEILDVVRRASEAIPLDYLGVDVVLDRVRGPLVLEVNARPGLEIQNVHGRGLATFLDGAHHPASVGGEVSA